MKSRLPFGDTGPQQKAVLELATQKVFYQRGIYRAKEMEREGERESMPLTEIPSSRNYNMR